MDTTLVYSGLLAKALPKVIETDEEFDRFATMLESLDFAERDLTPEESALEARSDPHSPR